MKESISWITRKAVISNCVRDVRDERCPKYRASIIPCFLEYVHLAFDPTENL